MGEGKGDYTIHWSSTGDEGFESSKAAILIHGSKHKEKAEQRIGI